MIAISPGTAPKTLDLIVHGDPSKLFDPTAQLLVGLGVALFLISWGAAKIIKALRGGGE